MVGNVESIQPIEKLHYLRSTLTDPAAQLISSLPMEAVSYGQAWRRLNERYGDPRALITAQLRRLHSLPKLRTPSAAALESLIGTVSDVVAALREHDHSVESYGFMVVHIMEEALDPATREAWEVHLTSLSPSPPTYYQIHKFLTARMKALEAAKRQHDTKASTSWVPTHRVENHYKPSVRANLISDPSLSTSSLEASTSEHPHLEPASGYIRSKTVCAYCQEAHFIMVCPAFRKKNPQERRKVVEERRLCFNCLGPHKVGNCSVTKRCTICDKNHHTMIHTEEPSPTTRSSLNESSATQASPSGRSHVLLATAKAMAQSSRGNLQRVLLLFDTGSVMTFISKALVHRLHLKISSAEIPLLGVGGISAAHTEGKTSITLHSTHNLKTSVTVTAYILKKLTARLPSFTAETISLQHFQEMDSRAWPFLVQPRAATDLSVFSCVPLLLFIGIHSSSSA